MLIRITAICTAAIGSLSVARAAEADRIDPNWLEKLQTQGKAALTRFAELDRRIEAETENRLEPLAGGPPGKPNITYPKYRVRYCRNEKNVKVEYARWTAGKDDPVFTLQCENDQYGFWLQKKSASDAYVLTKYDQRNPEKLLSQGVASLHSSASEGLTTALQASEQSNGYQLDGIGWDETRKLLRAVVHHSATSLRTQIWMDPDESWRLMEKTVESEHAVFHDTFSYGVVVDGLPLARESAGTAKYKKLPWMTTNSQLMEAKISEKSGPDFRLSAFGLPEPVDVAAESNRSRYLPFVLAAAVFVAVAVAFRWLAKRRSAGGSLPA